MTGGGRAAGGNWKLAGGVLCGGGKHGVDVRAGGLRAELHARQRPRRTQRPAELVCSELGGGSTPAADDHRWPTFVGEVLRTARRAGAQVRARAPARYCSGEQYFLTILFTKF